MTQIQKPFTTFIQTTIKNDFQIDENNLSKLMEKAVSLGGVNDIDREAAKMFILRNRRDISDVVEDRLDAFLNIQDEVLRTHAAEILSTSRIIDETTFIDLRHIYEAAVHGDDITNVAKLGLVDANIFEQELNYTTRILSTLNTEIAISLDNEVIFNGQKLSELDIHSAIQALTQFSTIIDKDRFNPLDRRGVGEQTIQNLFTALSELDERIASATVSTEMKKLYRAAQSSTMIAMATTLDSSKDLKKEICDTLVQLLENENDPLQKECMVIELSRNLNSLSRKAKSFVKKELTKIAPTKPPYEEWFKDGNNQLNVAMTIGPDPEALPGIFYQMNEFGFKLENPDDKRNPPDQIVFTKKIKRLGDTEPMDCRITVQVNHRDRIFSAMNDEDTHLVVYSGHSGFGRNVKKSLKNAPKNIGDKVVLLGLCAGKDNIQNFKRHYPGTQLMTTFTSSFYRTRNIDDQKTTTWSEDFNAMRVMLDAAAKQWSWKQINQSMRRKAATSFWHIMEDGENNYISPIHTQIRAKNLDQDFDGQVDELDKYFNTAMVIREEDDQLGMKAVEHDIPLENLHGGRFFQAIMGLNTMTGYNSSTSVYRLGGILGDGYFTPGSDEDPAFIFTPYQDGEGAKYKVQMNKNYAHLSEDSMRALAAFDFMQSVQFEKGFTPYQARMMGLIFATASLNYDSTMTWVDFNVWKDLLEYAGLPSDILYGDFRSVVDADHSNYTGSLAMISKIESKLTQDHKDALNTFVA